MSSTLASRVQGLAPLADGGRSVASRTAGAACLSRTVGAAWRRPQRPRRWSVLRNGVGSRRLWNESAAPPRPPPAWWARLQPPEPGVPLGPARPSRRRRPRPRLVHSFREVKWGFVPGWCSLRLGDETSPRTPARPGLRPGSAHRLFRLRGWQAVDRQPCWFGGTDLPIKPRGGARGRRTHSAAACCQLHSATHPSGEDAEADVPVPRPAASKAARGGEVRRRGWRASRSRGCAGWPRRRCGQPRAG